MSTPAPATGSGRVKALIAVLIVLVLVGGIWAATAAGRRSEPAVPAAGSYAVPKAATGATGGLVVNPDVPAGVPTVDIYLDFQCPWCKRFHDVFDAGFRRIMAADQAKIVVHTKTFLDQGENDSSARVALGAACASDAGRLWQYQNAAFAGQAAHEGDGFTDAQIRQFATDAGITGATLTTWQQCVAQRKYAGYVSAVEGQSTKDGVRGTPSYRIDGKDADLNSVIPEQGNPNPGAFFTQIPGVGR